MARNVSIDQALSTTYTLGPSAGMRAKFWFSHSLIYRLGIGFFVCDFLDVFSFIGYSEYFLAIKYAYTAAVLVLIFLYFLRFKTIDMSHAAPILAFLFFVITGAAFLINLVGTGRQASFVSSFTSSLIFASSIFIPADATKLDADVITRRMSFLLLLGAVAYTFETIIHSFEFTKGFLFFGDVEHVKSIVCVLAVCMSILIRQDTRTLLLLLLSGVALVLRPSSTFAIALMLCVPLAAVLRVGVVRGAQRFAKIALSLTIIGPLLLYFFFDTIAPLVESTEEYFKVDLLGGFSNSSFRLLILKRAFYEFGQSSFWYGNGLSGDSNVFIAPEYGDWLNYNANGLVPIHSDFVAILVLSGCIGYFLFAAMLYSCLSSRSRWLTSNDFVDGNHFALVSISVVALLTLAIYCSFNPFLINYQHTHIIWFLLLISEMVLKESRIRVLQRHFET
jgi:hypothetical protein